MSTQPNRHVICYTAENKLTGETFDDQFPQTIRGDLVVAGQALAAMIATVAAEKFPQSANTRALRLHSWYEAPLRPLPPVPMSGPENDKAWFDGPGSPAL